MRDRPLAQCYHRVTTLVLKALRHHLGRVAMFAHHQMHMLRHDRGRVAGIAPLLNDVRASREVQFIERPTPFKKLFREKFPAQIQSPRLAVELLLVR